MNDFDSSKDYSLIYEEYLKKKMDRSCRKSKKYDSSGEGSLKGEASPILTPSFLDSGGNITDNEYEVTSEME